MKITIEGKVFELDIKRAKELNVIKPYREPITDVSVGDVFLLWECPMILVRAVWAGSFDTQSKCYAFCGLTNGLESYSNYDRLFSKEEVIEHINDNKYVKIGNINSGIREIVAELMKKHNYKTE